ncbi:MAG: response regulator [Sporomusaceae bacterium]|nr:response regulator [Sporomusaceae bacterium]
MQYYKNTVLFVDDEISVLNSLKRGVADEPFWPLFATSAEAALELLAKHEVSVLVTDIRMPGTDGIAFLQKIKGMYPNTLRIVLSGYALLSLDQVLAAMNHGEIYRFITKPWRMEEDLLPVLRQGIEYYNLIKEKQNIERSLQHKNEAYKKMLRLMEEKSATAADKIGHVGNVFTKMFSGLERELHKSDRSWGKAATSLKIVEAFTSSYFKTMPAAFSEFTLSAVAEALQQHVKERHSGLRYQEKLPQELVTVMGNGPLLQMILACVIDLVCWSGDDRKVDYILSFEKYQDRGLVRMSNVFQLGYVDGATVLIDSDELLTYENLDYYVSLLSLMGAPYGITATYTYVNQNTSMISVVAELLIA